MNVLGWFTLTAIVAVLIIVPILMLRTILSLLGPNRRKNLGAAAIAVALLGLERFIRPAEEHVQQANDGEVDQDAIGDGFGPQEWIAKHSDTQPDR